MEAAKQNALKEGGNQGLKEKLKKKKKKKRLNVRRTLFTSFLEKKIGAVWLLDRFPIILFLLLKYESTFLRRTVDLVFFFSPTLPVSLMSSDR